MNRFVFWLEVVYTAAGLSAFACFMALGYYSAAVFGFITAAISATSAHVTWLHLKDRLTIWYERRELNQLFWCGFCSFAAGFTGLVYHIVSLSLLKEFDMFLVTGTVWCFMTIKSGAVLMHISDKFMENQDEVTLLA